MKYTVTAVQLALRSSFVAGQGFDPARFAANFDHTEALLRRLAGETGSQLYLLPEFSFQGWAMGVPLEHWNAAAVRIPGPETDRIGRLARELGAYVAGTLFESIPEFPGRHFLTGFVIAPSGELVLRYRKLYAFSAKTRPGDVYERWIGLFGRESLFPVVDTPLGRLGMMIAWDAQFPEVARALALRGADVILHPLGSGRVAADHGAGFTHLREVRAHENVCYLVSANMGPLDSAGPEMQGRWPSQVIDPEGRVLAATTVDGESHATATIDLELLRAQRNKPVRNWLAQLQSQLHAPDYAAAQLWPLSHWEQKPLVDAREQLELEAQIVRTLAAGPAIRDEPTRR
ncbi:MAG: nitrilase-related carbon-nitrogen hydrolase [Steroidobacteraceae bacterium]